MKSNLSAAILSAFAFATAPAFSATFYLNATDRNNTPLPYAVVTLTPVNIKPSDTYKSTDAQVEQRSFKFEPFVSVVRRGTKMTFPNRDTAEHHVASLSGPTNFSLKSFTAKQGHAPVVMDELGRVTVHCLLHHYMVAHIYVVDTPWHAISDERGALEIRDLPEGEYELKVDHHNMLTESMLRTKVPKRIKLTNDRVDPLAVQFDFVHKARR